MYLAAPKSEAVGGVLITRMIGLLSEQDAVAGSDIGVVGFSMGGTGPTG